MFTSALRGAVRSALRRLGAFLVWRKAKQAADAAASRAAKKTFPLIADPETAPALWARSNGWSLSRVLPQMQFLGHSWGRMFVWRTGAGTVTRQVFLPLAKEELLEQLAAAAERN